MGEEFEGRDLSGAVFWGVDLSRATFRDVDLSGVPISHALLDGVEIDGTIGRLVVNGVDVTEFVARTARFGAWLGTDPDLDAEADVLENGRVTVRDCVFTVLEEEFEHHRYADRDLTTLERS